MRAASPLRGIHPAALAAALLVSAAASLPATAREPEGVYERLSGEVVSEALFAPEALPFRPPPGAALAELAGTRGGGASAAASWVVLNDELGASDRFTGTGSGVELRFDLRRRSGWGASMALSRVDRGLHSMVDDREARVDRYLLGASYRPPRPRGWTLAPGAGLAWNIVDIDGTDPALDIEGLGGYAELRAVGALGGRWWFEASARAIYWRGKDGLGGSGRELSVVVGLGLGLRF